MIFLLEPAMGVYALGEPMGVFALESTPFWWLPIDVSSVSASEDNTVEKFWVKQQNSEK